MGSIDRLPRPPFDVEIFSLMPPISDTIFPRTKDDIPKQREFFENLTGPVLPKILSDPDIKHTEHIIPGPRGDITLSVFAPTHTRFNKAGEQPGIFHIHGGGMTAGNRFSGIGMVIDWVKELDAVAISVEYRLPPEHPYPAPIDDCYEALLWVGEHRKELGVDPARLMIEGQSVGGGLAAATALMVRDKGGPTLCAQLLGVPMLDDRNNSVSAQQFATGGTWNSQANAFGWTCLLGDSVGGKDVSSYASPARATDLSRLPPAYLDISSTEPFRDEVVAYATNLWRDGTQAELHVWPGGPHAFDIFTPQAALSKLSINTRSSWVRRMLEGGA